MSKQPRDVIVIGAGAAGLAASRRLSAAGMQVKLLEAPDRIDQMAEPDLSFDEFLRKHCADVPDRIKNMAIAFVEGSMPPIHSVREPFWEEGTGISLRQNGQTRMSAPPLQSESY